jgi:hypothetical protein
VTTYLPISKTIKETKGILDVSKLQVQPLRHPERKLEQRGVKSSVRSKYDTQEQFFFSTRKEEKLISSTAPRMLSTLLYIKFV